MKTTGRSHRKLMVWGFAILLITLVAGKFISDWLDRQAAEKAIAGSKVTERTHVYALGRLEPAGTVVRVAAKSGNEGATLESLLVHEGEDVYSGKTIAVLDTKTRRAAALVEAEARVALAEAQLAKVRAGAKAGDIQSQEAAALLVDDQSRVVLRELQRMKQLAESNAVSQEALEQKQWEYDRLLIEHQRLTSLVASTKEIREVDVNAALQDVAVAKAAVERAKADLEASEVRAPFSGRILRIHTREGERIRDTGIVELGNVAQMDAVAEVFEADIPSIKLGMEAEVRLDASGRPLKGRVSEIGHLVARKIVLTNDPVSDTDARVIEVRIALDEHDRNEVQRLSNSRVEVRISLTPAGGSEASASTVGKAAF
ncbi:MAG: HlyD family efflux transporter periplasmic adaptor subunit [Planctomyces sp.]|nr:HlyD family efflux transporter periplasmic adaptor subunit [Planctomyces sp.]